METTVTQPRRSRRYRQPVGSPPVIHEGDIAVFELLARQRYLDTNQLYGMLAKAPNLMVFKWRLRKLYDFGYLDRPPQQRHDLHAPCIYELDTKGRECVRERGHSGTYSDLVTRGKHGAVREFAHAKMIHDVLASIEKGAKAAGVRFITWQEILSKVPEKTQNAANPYRFPRVKVYHPETKKPAEIALIPDALFGLEFTTSEGKKFMRFALEAEHRDCITRKKDFEKQNSFLKKALAYQALMRRGNDGTSLVQQHLGIPGIAVLGVAPTLERVEGMKNVIMQITEGKGSNRFFFNAIPVHGYPYKAPPPPMLDYFNAPWQCAGRDDFYINKL